jgi:hypothetical protein
MARPPTAYPSYPASMGVCLGELRTLSPNCYMGARYHPSHQGWYFLDLPHLYSVRVENKQNRPGHFRTRMRTGWVVGAPWARPTLIAAPSGHAWGRAAPFRRQKAVLQPKTPMAGRSKKRSRQINTIKMDHTTSRPHTLGSWELLARSTGAAMAEG